MGKKDFTPLIKDWQHDYDTDDVLPETPINRFIEELFHCLLTRQINGSRYSRTDQVKFVKDSP